MTSLLQTQQALATTHLNAKRSTKFSGLQETTNKSSTKFTGRLDNPYSAQNNLKSLCILSSGSSGKKNTTYTRKNFTIEDSSRLKSNPVRRNNFEADDDKTRLWKDIPCQNQQPCHNKPFNRGLNYTSKKYNKSITDEASSEINESGRYVSLRNLVRGHSKVHMQGNETNKVESNKFKIFIDNQRFKDKFNNKKGGGDLPKNFNSGDKTNKFM